MWQEKGSIFDNIRPGVKGDMLVDENEKIYIFDPSASAMTSFKTSNAPPERYVPEYTEEWMNSSGERLSRKTVRLFRTAINNEPSLLFNEYGQRSYWWVSKDIKTIYILVEWRDAIKEKPEPAHLSFWKSTNGGNEFSKVKWTDLAFGRGSASGMYFDNQGIYGYVFVNKNTLLQTKDAGETWQKVYIPHTEAKSLPYMNGIVIDTATVDEQGNLLFALFNKVKRLSIKYLLTTRK